MVDYNELRKKFKPKNQEEAEAHKRTKEAVKRIAKEYERKRTALGLDQPTFKRGPVYYIILTLVMVVLAGAFIGVMTGTISVGRKRISKADLQVRQSVDALAVALGRYKYHVGKYPSEEEGIEELARIRTGLKGWFGPYIKKNVPDPWGEQYVYWLDGERPVLMSKGPDRKMGTDDDILPKQELFSEPFRDTTWTNHWVPYQLRGIVVAPDEATRKRIQDEVKQF